MGITGSKRPQDPATCRNADFKADGDCAPCEVKQPLGLAILPVVPTVIPNSLRGAWTELDHLDGRYDSSELKKHWYAARTLPPGGFLYVLKPDLTWNTYFVDREGRLNKTLDVGTIADATLDMIVVDRNYCQGDVLVIDPEKYAAVWLAFSHYRWTKQVMADYAANKGGRRDARMVKLDVMAAAAGSLGKDHKAHNAVRFGMPMRASVGSSVADYSSKDSVSISNKHLLTPLRDRSGQGPALAARMAEISKSTAGKTGAILVLPDALGLAMEGNGLRNAETARMAAYATAHQREQVVADIILGFQQSFEQSGKGEDWGKRYAKHYDRTKVKAAKDSYDSEMSRWDQHINAMSEDVATLNGKPPLKSWWYDFDPLDDKSARDRQDATARCVHGAVKVRAEIELWDKWFNEDPTDPLSTVWGAITGLDAEFGQFMLGKSLPDTGKLDEANEIAGRLNDLVPTFQEVAKKFRARLQMRANGDAMALIGSTMVGQIARLRSLRPELYRVAGIRVLFGVTAWTTVTVTPRVISLSRTQLRWMLTEATFGPPQATIKKLVDEEMRSGRRVFVAGTKGVGIYAQDTHTLSKERVYELWLPEEIGRDLPMLPAPPVRLALPPPKLNPYKALVDFTLSAKGLLSWAGLTLQVLNIWSNANDLSNQDDKDKADEKLGVAAGIFGLLGVMAEIGAEVAKKRVAAMAARSVGTRLALFGGFLGAASSITEGIQALVKGNQRARAGDYDAAFSYRVASGFLIASGLAGIGAGLAAASLAGTLTGTVGFLASAGAAAATIPVVGWIAAAAVFLGLGVYFLWRALRDTDNPLEVWLRRSFYGYGSPTFPPQEEMDELNKIIYAMTIESEWNDRGGYDGFRFSVGLPGVGTESVLYCKVIVFGQAVREEVLDRVLRFENVGGQIVAPAVAGPGFAINGPGPGTKYPSFYWEEPPSISKGDSGLRYGGFLRLDDDLYHSAELEIQYWPDAQAMPTLVLPREVDKRTLIVRD